ncbi:MAG: hypothetical protein AAFU77_03190 [Myxococcota bacterium]
MTDEVVLRLSSAGSYVYNQWSLKDLTDNTEPDRNYTLGVYCSPYWVPFRRVAESLLAYLAQSRRSNDLA